MLRKALQLETYSPPATPVKSQAPGPCQARSKFAAGFSWLRKTAALNDTVSLQGLLGPKLLVSDRSTFDQPVLRWRFRVTGNRAVEFGVVPSSHVVKAAQSFFWASASSSASLHAMLVRLKDLVRCKCIFAIRHCPESDSMHHCTLHISFGTGHTSYAAQRRTLASRIDSSLNSITELH